MGNTHIAEAVNEIFNIPLFSNLSYFLDDIIFLKVELKDNIDCIFKP